MVQRVLVYGGSGALGRTLVSTFKSSGWWTMSVDFTPNPEADSNTVLIPNDTPSRQEEQVKSALQDRVDAILCVAGGWAGGNSSNKEFLSSCISMVGQSVNSSVVCASIAGTHLNDGGFLALTGAAAAVDPTPGMIGYGMAKAAVHHLVRSLGAEGNGLPTGACAIAILPITLDTPMNRKWMPKADTTTWTPLDFIGKLFQGWADNADSRPASGSLIKLKTVDGMTSTLKVDIKLEEETL